MQSHDVYEELRRESRQFGVEKLAAMMGMSPGTLYNKLNLNDTTAHHKITLADYIQIITFTRQAGPHRALSTMLGGVFHLLPDMSDKSDEALLDIVNRVHIEGGDVHRELAAALATPSVTRDQAARIEREALQWVAAILELRARVNGMVGDGNHS
ncbi:phage regulatory CII family protein [Gulbenkiania mobilis]|uniref:phage regulatory CII family protein n=1 Tax=Gulbenkiania mobilis TaxID=397457 RepID=UPI0006BBF7EF|nr:phage regulatory CII family protein [Gulbenkiania mobilis]